MSAGPNFADVTTAIVAALTVWMLVARYRGMIESNWPLLYYFGVVTYSWNYPGVLDSAWVYGGVVCALLLRFEFMGGVFLKIIRFIDFLVLLYVLYASTASLLR